MQTFEKGGSNFRYFTQWGMNLEQIPILRQKLGLWHFSFGEKHDSEIIWPARVCNCILCSAWNKRQTEKLTVVQYSCIGWVSLWCLAFLPEKKQFWHMSKLKHRKQRYLKQNGGKKMNLSHLVTKLTKWHVRPAKTQISLGICPIWSESSLSQPAHPPSLIIVFDVRMKKAWVLSYSLSAQRRLWSDWVDAQADLSLCWAHSHFVGFIMRQLISIWSKCLFWLKQLEEIKRLTNLFSHYK